MLCCHVCLLCCAVPPYAVLCPQVRDGLVPLITQLGEKGTPPNDAWLKGKFSVEKQVSLLGAAGVTKRTGKMSSSTGQAVLSVLLFTWVTNVLP